MPTGGRAVLVLRDGVCVPVREIRAEDAPALQRLVGRSSSHSIELRFFGPMKELSDRMARRFAEVDGRDRFALVALDPDDADEIVGVVRYEREEGTDGAEYAALVELTRQLIEAARARGIGHLHALVLPENEVMLRLLRSLNLPERERWDDGIEHVEIHLRPVEAA
jgi:RimJ/RimL family protein N-acetyltransferase